MPFSELLIQFLRAFSCDSIMNATLLYYGKIAS
jgi:hypothetical protein